MHLYRMITGPDDSEFCHRISKALSNGWELAGSSSLTYDPKKARVICGQAVTKEIDGQEYSPDLAVSDY